MLQNINNPASPMVIQYAANDLAMPGKPPPFVAENRKGQTRPEKMFRETTDRLSAAIRAASFARKSVLARTGNGASTRTSRLSGKMESQHRTEKRLTTTIVVAIRKCSIIQRKTFGNLPPAPISQNVNK